MRLALALLALLLPGGAVAQTLTPAAIDAEATRAMAGLKPAGMAVAVVEDGRIVFARGYGVRRNGAPGRIDADTAMPLASVSKAFTAAALGILVDEGKIGWDEPVHRYLPEFAMADPYLTEHLSVRDLLVHRSGLALGAGDLLRWPDGNATDAEMMRALPHLPLASGFRDRFEYDNILYVAAGQLVQRLSGQSWADFVAARLFRPLGLTSCTGDPDRTRPANRAVQHGRATGGDMGQPLDRLVVHPDPAGSIACSVTDVARWAVFQLGDGRAADGTRVLKPETLAALHTGVIPVTPFGPPARAGLTHLAQYGLGWFVSDFGGALLWDHSGADPGAASEIGVLPEKRAAVVVLINDMAPAPLVGQHLLARLVRGDAAPDLLGDAIARRAARRGGSPSAESAAPPSGTPGRALAAYAGTYRDPWYGDITVAVQSRGLVIHLTRSVVLKGPLVPLGGDRFLARWPDRHLGADAIVTFVPDAGGAIGRMRLEPASPKVDFSYDYAHLAPVRVR